MSNRREFLIAAAAGLVAGPVWGQQAMEGRMQPVTERNWSYVADTVMGGVSDGQATMEAVDGRPAIHLTGTVSTANNGGFIQVRTELENGLPGDAEGVVLQVRGNGERYFIHLRTRATVLPWQYYQAGFETDGAWREVRIPFSAFRGSGRLLPGRIAPGTVRSIGLVAFGRDHQADVALAALGTY